MKQSRMALQSILRERAKNGFEYNAVIREAVDSAYEKLSLKEKLDMDAYCAKIGIKKNQALELFFAIGCFLNDVMKEADKNVR